MKQDRWCSKSTRADSHRVLGIGMCYSKYLVCIILFLPDSSSMKHRTLLSLFYIQARGGPERFFNLSGVTEPGSGAAAQL